MAAPAERRDFESTKMMKKVMGAYFMELAAGYQKRKRKERRYPACFES